MIGFLNRLLHRTGFMFIKQDTLAEMIEMNVAYRVILNELLEPGQIAVYDREEHEVKVVTVQ